MKRWLITCLKIGLPLALFVWLLRQIPASDYEDFFSRPKRWDCLLGAQAIALVAVIITFTRWQKLVHAFGIPFTTAEAMKLGFLSYFMNFVSFGSIGGDLFKAVLVAKQKPQARPEAVASVLLDRAIGLLGLIILAAISLVIFPPKELSAVFVSIRDVSIILSIGSIVALMLAVFSGRWFDRLINWGERLPILGSPLAKWLAALAHAAQRHAPIVSLIVASVCVHSMLALSIYLISCGLYPDHPSLTEHLFVVPTGMAAGALPLAPGGLGTQEFVLDRLFGMLQDRTGSYSGVLVSTVYRLITLAIAGIGLVYYGTSRGKELAEARVAAEELARADESREPQS
ncbi:MAG: lysylphosphatidylglycerol synthase transmembrane domain-containing protein [Pirellulales bacterium]